MGFPVAWALLCASLTAGAHVPPLPAFSLVVSSALDAQGGVLAQEEWLRAQLDAADALFAPFGVTFAASAGPPLEARFAHVETRADRDAFASHLAPRGIHVFVVDSLRDVDDPAEMRRGVHWHAPSGAHYVILVASAPPTVLAHELGHFFGNPHSRTMDNVMSYERSGAPPFFDAEQGRRITSRAREYLRKREFLPVPP